MNINAVILTFDCIRILEMKLSSTEIKADLTTISMSKWYEGYLRSLI